MIEQETTIMMRCDECGNVLVDNYGYIIRVDGFDDDRFAYAQLCRRAIDMGWKCSEGSCLCLACRKDVQDE